MIMVGRGSLLWVNDSIDASNVNTVERICWQYPSLHGEPARHLPLTGFEQDSDIGGGRVDGDPHCISFTAGGHVLLSISGFYRRSGE